MDDARPTPPTRWQRETSWSDLGYEELPDRLKSGWFVLAHDQETAPDSATTVMQVHYPPNFHVPPHTHNVAYAEIVVAGTVEVTRRSYGPGDIRVVGAGTGYGPVVAGPDGATVIIVFDGRDWPHVPLKAGAEGEAEAGFPATPERESLRSGRS